LRKALPSIAGEHDGHAAHAHLKRARAFCEAQYEAQVVLCHLAAMLLARPRPPGRVSDVGSHGNKVTAPVEPKSAIFNLLGSSRER